MSIGLNDLGKKNRSKKVTPVKTVDSGKSKKTAARPWTQTDLGRQTSAMNEDWSRNMQVTPLFWVDIAQNSSVMRLQKKLAVVEEQVYGLVSSRVSNLLKFCSFGKLKSRN